MVSAQGRGRSDRDGHVDAQDCGQRLLGRNARPFHEAPESLAQGVVLAEKRRVARLLGPALAAVRGRRANQALVSAVVTRGSHRDVENRFGDFVDRVDAETIGLDVPRRETTALDPCLEHARERIAEVEDRLLFDWSRGCRRVLRWLWHAAYIGRSVDSGGPDSPPRASTKCSDMMLSARRSTPAWRARVR